MSIEQNIENLEIRNANVVTFVGTSSTMVDTISGRIQCKGFQHNSNVITDVSGPHGRGAAVLKKYPEIAFKSGKFDANDSTNTYVQAGYTVTASSQAPPDERNPWSAFDDNDFTHHESNYNVHLYDGGNGANPGFATTNAAETTNVDGSGTYRGEWLQIEVPNKIKLNKYVLGKRANNIAGIMPKEAKILGSNDGTNWTTVYDHNDTGGVYSTSLSVVEKRTFQVNSSSYYKYFRLATNKMFETGLLDNNNTLTPNIAEWSLYGYEEDPPAGDHSVDTTFKSRFNNPQLTGVQVFVDGKGSGSNQIAGGPTVTDTVESYDETGKYWNLTGELTSNISVEANTFLEGDQPHAVSVWFNSSNLEANVSNTCVFSISDQEKLDSVNLDLQSNTWHNLTYSYQGEGGSRVTYLDGRKVAEDQAEDTFGEYPPFAMTGYSQGGYVVSASTEYTTFSAWNGFDKIQSANTIQNHWSGSSQKYNTSDGDWGGDTASVYTTNVEGVNKYGEWLQIEFPYKIKYNYSKIKAPYNYTERQPRDGYIVGSNDLSGQWTTLHRFTGVTRSSGTETVTYTPPSAPTNAFKYIRLVIEALTASTGQYAGVDEWDIYGHRENDLVRLPDPTNVLKYPHIVTKNGTGEAANTWPNFTSYAQRGHVIKASSWIGSYPPYAAFNGQTHVATGTVWVGGFNQYGSSHGNGTGGYGGGRNLKTDLGTGGSATSNGEWLYIEMPHKIKVTSTKIVSYDTSPSTGHPPENLIIYGTNDPSSSGGWNVVDNTYASSSSGVPNNTTGKSWTVSTASSPTAYKYFAYVLVKVNNSGTLCHAVLSDWQLIGTGVDSIPIQIGGGNIDKVANFRVYNKFVEEDQALEIWNAQKDEFGRAKPQMVLQQGKLGIGTDAPQGSLSIADEPDPDAYGLQEFPPKPLVGYKTHIEGHGEFCVTESSFDDSSGDRHGWRAFNKSHMRTSDGNLYTSQWDPISYDTNGIATGNNGVLNGVNGEYLILESPYKIKLSHVLIYPRIHVSTSVSYSLPPKDGKIWGRNTIAEPWTEITSYANLTYGATRTDNLYGQKPTRVNINATQYYKYIAFQITATNISLTTWSTRSYVNFKELRYFGYREQVTKQSVLHDGQLTLTKNLTVPRIGPALDADYTPRRDRLVVEYNTSTNPSFEGAVRDTSGRGVDGILVGSSYNTNKKAFTFSSGNQYINTTLPIPKNGNFIHSMSMWFNPLSLDAADGDALVFIGDNTNNFVGRVFVSFSMSDKTFRRRRVTNHKTGNLDDRIRV